MHHLGVLVCLLHHHSILLHLLALDLRLLLIRHGDVPNRLSLGTGHDIPHLTHLRSLLLSAEVYLSVTVVGLHRHLTLHGSASNMHPPPVSALMLLLLHIVAEILEGRVERHTAGRHRGLGRT